MKNRIRNIFKEAKIKNIKVWASFFVAIIFMLLVSTASLIINRESKFTSISSMGFLIVLSLFANFILYSIIKKCYEISIKGKVNRYYIIGSIVSVIVVSAIYIYSIISREMIYFWDFSNYYKIQMYLTDVFSQNVFMGIKSVVRSLLLDDYSCFICIFLAAPFMLIPKLNVDGYIIEYLILGVIPVVLTFNMLVYKLIEVFKVKREKIVYTLTMITIVLFPLLHYSALIGQPDVYGLIFVNLILLITVDYDFSEVEVDRLVLIFITTLALIFTRRWYLYWIVGYYVSYALILIIKGIANKKSIKNLIVFGAISAVLCLVLLAPMVLKILRYDYGEHYAAYNLGGLSYEIGNQINYLGYAMMFMAVAGFILGIIKKETRDFTIIVLGTLIISMVFFTNVQNAGYHQSLIFAPEYLLFIFMLYTFISKLRNDMFVKIVSIIIGIIVAANFSFAIQGKTANGLFSNADLRPIVRDDFKDIEEIVNFIDTNVTEENTMYIIPHGEKYNPDIFRNFNLPEKIDNKIAYGSAILGTHTFPVEFLTSKYILTCDPIDDSDYSETSIVKNLDTALNHLKEEGKFKLVKRFEFSNGYVFECYERVENTDLEEINYLKDVFRYQSERFPDMFEGVLNGYAQNLNK